MGNKKVFCRRASELKSIEELQLPKKAERILKLIDCPMVDVVEAIRTNCGYWDFRDPSKMGDARLIYFWEVLASNCDHKYDYNAFWTEYSEDEVNTLINGKMFSEEENKTIISCFAKNGFLRDNSDFESAFILDYFVDDWFDDTCLFTVWGYNDCFNEKYECYSGLDVEEKVSRIKKLLKSILTKAQYEVAKFDIKHYNEYFAFSEEEESLLEAAKINAENFLKDSIIDIILS